MRTIKKAAVDQSVMIRIVDESTGIPETGVNASTTGLDLFYRREHAAKVSITEVDLSALTDAHSDGGIFEIGNGYYRLDVPDAAFATGADNVLVGGTVTGMIVMGVDVQLVSYDPQDAVRAGLTALPNANAAAANGLPILGANASAISFTAGMVISSASGTALSISSSGSNGAGILCLGNGTGAGLLAEGGTTGHGARFVSNLGSGGAQSGISLEGGSASGFGMIVTSGGGGNFSALFPADVTKWNGTTIASPDTAGYPKVTIKDGTGAGEIDTSAGGVLVSAFANDSITAAALAASAGTELAAAVLAATVDGQAVSTILEILLAMVQGKVSVVDGGLTRTFSFKKRDGSTQSFSIVASTVAGAEGQRAATGTIGP